MKKLVLLATLSLVIIVLLSSCVKSQQIQENNHNKTASPISLNISEKNAVKIIKSIIGTDKGKRIIEFDRLEKLNGRSYLVIHAYSLGEGMSFTYGWYYVDRISGKPYNVKVDGISLVPLTK